MKNIQLKIKTLQTEIQNLKEIQKESMDSVIKEREKGYYNSFKDTCSQVIHLINGWKWDYYSKYICVTQDKEWKKETYYNNCLIYDETGVGEPIGFICTEDSLFMATRNYHKDMWIERIKNSSKKEIRSFEDFCDNLNTDVSLLICCFEDCVKEKGSGVYYTEGYLQTYENKKLSIPKHYIYLKNKARKINY